MSAWFWIPNQQKAKGNPNHSPTDGKFTSGGGGGSAREDKLAALKVYNPKGQYESVDDRTLDVIYRQVILGESTSDPKKAQAEYAKQQQERHGGLPDRTEQYANGLSKKDKQLLIDYTTDDGNEMVNSTLRGTEHLNVFNDYLTDKDRVKAKEITRVLDAAFKDKGNRLSKDSKLYRGVKDSSLIASMKVGSVITDKGFVSTSYDPEVAAGFSRDETSEEETEGGLITINARKGQPAMGMENMSEGGGEQEVLLPRNSKFKVVSKRGNKVTLEALR